MRQAIERAVALGIALARTAARIAHHLLRDDLGTEALRPLGAWRGPWYRMSPLLGALTHLHLGPASAGPFSISGGRARFLGGVTLEMYNEFHHQAPVTERPVAL